MTPVATRWLQRWALLKRRIVRHEVIDSEELHRVINRKDKLHAVVSSTGNDLRSLTRPDLFLDAAALNQKFSALRRLGVIPAHVGSRFSQAVAQRMALSFGRRFEYRLQVPAQTLAEAWYFPIWCELCRLIPIRHLARVIARSTAGKPVLVPLEGNRASYLSYWERSAVEAFFLVSELRRAGADAMLVVDEAAAAASPAKGGGFIYRLEPDTLFWGSDTTSKSTDAQHRKAIVLSGIRGFDRVLKQLGNPLLVQAPFGPAETAEANATLSPNATEMPSIDLNFVELPRNRRLDPLRLLTCELPWPSLADGLFHALGSRSKTAAEAAARLVVRHGIEEAHVGDHMFFESAFVAHATRAVGGRVVLWPHSSNALHLSVRGHARPDLVHCVTKASAALWSARYPGLEGTIVSELMFKPCSVPRPLVPNQPITVVVIAGSHNLNRMPVLDFGGHSESYRCLFTGLATLLPHVRFVVKAKAPWESIEWLRSVVEPGVTLEEVSESPTTIDLPNMIYVTVSFGSTALLEGLGRGIPGMVVRDIPVEDYAAIDPAHVPVGTAEIILGEIQKCLDPAHFAEITLRQLAWYRSQTRFTENSS
jgi:hypothetical protein